MSKSPPGLDTEIVPDDAVIVAVPASRPITSGAVRVRFPEVTVWLSPLFSLSPKLLALIKVEPLGALSEPVPDRSIPVGTVIVIAVPAAVEEIEPSLVKVHGQPTPATLNVIGPVEASVTPLLIVVP